RQQNTFLYEDPTEATAACKKILQASGGCICSMMDLFNHRSNTSGVQRAAFFVPRGSSKSICTIDGNGEPAGSGY
ncbi:MAG: hypothetical protein PHY29_10670, partial [Syntrophales bacterium]|nr:hypothetical protein [Syntrophales bacterium]